MVPIVKSLPSYIKDTNHALEIFRDFNFSGENKLNFTVDITSLYTVIPNNEGLQALRFFFRPAHYQRTQLGNTAPFSRTSFDTELLFICRQLLQTGQRRRYGHQNGT